MVDGARGRARLIRQSAGHQQSWFVRRSYAAVAAFPELDQYLRGYRVIFEDYVMRVLERP